MMSFHMPTPIFSNLLVVEVQGNRPQTHKIFNGGDVGGHNRGNEETKEKCPLYLQGSKSVVTVINEKE